MDCKGVFIGFAKHTIAFVSSSFDMGSDFVNALNFLGYFKNSSPTNVTLSLSNSSFLSNTSNMTVGNVEEPMVAIKDQVHYIWGILSMFLIFLPGLVGFFPIVIKNIFERNWCVAFALLGSSILFPIFFLGYQLFAIIRICIKREVNQFEKTFITTLTGLEAAIESTGQLMLQIFAIINGYPSTTIQKITIISSFFQIGRAAILNDIENKNFINKEDSLSFFQSLIQTLKRIPMYVPTIVFRVGSMVVTMAYLRWFSIIPITLLLVEMICVSWIRYDKLGDKEEVMRYVTQLTMSNVGVFNAYSFGQEPEDKEEEEDINNFIVRSNITTFFHHTIVISIIMVVGCFHPSFVLPVLILKPEDGTFYMVLAGIIGMGALSLTINLCRVYWSEISNCCCSGTEIINNDTTIELQESIALKSENE